MKLWIENINNPSAVYQEADPGGLFEDMNNDPVCWDVHGIGAKHEAGRKLDYKFVRDQLKILAATEANADFSNWASVSEANKEIYSRWHVAPYTLRVPGVQTEEKDKEYWRDVVFKTEGIDVDKLQGRARIYEEMRLCVADYVRRYVWDANDYLVNLSNAQALFKDVFLLKEYFIAANDPSFKQWICNEVGSSYENDGFEEKSYHLQDLEDDLLDIYAGIYNGIFE